MIISRIKISSYLAPPGDKLFVVGLAELWMQRHHLTDMATAQASDDKARSQTGQAAHGLASPHARYPRGEEAYRLCSQVTHCITLLIMI